MSATPPPLPVAPTAKPASFRSAFAINLFLPGAGLFLLGRRGLGLTFAVAFMICFLGVLGLFIAGYVHYISGALDPNLLQGDHLEQLGAGFRPQWLIGLGACGVIIYGASVMVLSRVRKSGV